MKIALAQVSPIVGDETGNALKIKEAYRAACRQGARVLITPEMALCGYPLLDWIERPEVFEAGARALEDLRRETQWQTCALIVGRAAPHLQDLSRRPQNMATILEGGKIVFQQAKTLLPDYDVFDESRYFDPAEKIQLWECEGRRIAIAICEDLWGRHEAFQKRFYHRCDPQESYRKQGAQAVFSLSASPYDREKRALRHRVHGDVARALNAPVTYVNAVGATDELLFDGESFMMNAQGGLIAELPRFEEALRVSDDQGEELHSTVHSEGERGGALEKGLILGIQEYFKRTGFKKAVLGLSGGIDSAVVAVLCAKALGAKNVHAVAMPGPFSSPQSLEDAEFLAKKWGIIFEIKPIKFSFSVLDREWIEGASLAGDELARENLQSRLRGMTLMTLANRLGALVINTGNKSELATGYCTVHGDLIGALSPLGDLYKTQVYELAHWMNATGNAIPARSVERCPTAELRANQKDQDSLPPYDLLDRVLELYFEGNLSIAEIETKVPQDWVRGLLVNVARNEYKRRQAPPVLRVSRRAFGIGRRVPIAKKI